MLLVAYACSPVRGSEAGVGWNRAVQSAKHHDTWVLCEETQFAADIGRHLKEHGEIPGLRFVFLARSTRETRIGHVPGLWYLSYNLWQRRAYRLAQTLHQEVAFDLVHQLTYCGYREPGYLWKLGAPFVWGPVGGSQNYPFRFLAYAGIGGAIAEASRSVLNSLQLRLSPRVRRAAKRSNLLLTANSTNQRDFARVLGVGSQRMLETGVSDALCRATETNARSGGPLRILWSGVFGHHKALPLLLDALAALPSSVDYELRIVGDGSLAAGWKSRARRLGVDPRCRWLGWLPHDEALRQYDWADVFAFTSLRDTSGNVVLEALAQGVPVICFDHQGAGDMVTGECGIKIPVAGPRQAVEGFRNAIERLSADAASLERLRHGARRQGLAYAWSRQGERMSDVYGELLEQTGRN